MSTKLYDRKTAAFAAFVIQAMPEGLTEEIMDGWMQNPQALKRLLAGLGPSVAGFLKLTPTLVPATATKSTEDCFRAPMWKYRDSRFATWLKKAQPRRAAQLVTVIRPEKPWTFIEFAQAVLGVATSDVKGLGNLLIQRDHTLTLTQAERLAERTEAGEATGLNTDGYANFFFVETGDKCAPVEIGLVNNSALRDWRAGLDSLVSYARHSVGYRFLLCNADTSKL